jgi:hypothetical protein
MLVIVVVVPAAKTANRMARHRQAGEKAPTAMKTLFINETIPRSGRSGTIQAPDSPQNANGRKLWGDGAFLTGLSWSPKSGWSPVRGIDESPLMVSQLG